MTKRRSFMFNITKCSRFLVLFACLIGSFVNFQSALAATFYVKPNGNDANDGSSWALAKQTIQAAITVASGQDLVLVADGTYGPIVVDKFTILPSLTIRSVNGPAVTIIDGGGSARCVELVSTVTLDGFTLTNGLASIGGGLLMTGGGLATNCVISGNTATQRGGGAYLNTPVGHAAMSKIVNSTISGNTAGDEGGGVYLVRGVSVSAVENSIIRGNVAGRAGGVEVTDRCWVRNCLIMGNSATNTYGGGVNVEVGGIVESCTIVGNSANTAGGGAIIPIQGVVLNSIMYYNQAGLGADMYGPLENSCYGVGSDISGDNNTTDEPLFVSAGSGYGASHVPGDYRLTSASPARNTGVNQDWMSIGGATDLAGNPRIQEGTVNMGAYESLGVSKQSQTINFPVIANQKITDTLTLTATASSGLTVSFSKVSGPATIGSGNKVTFSNTGEVSIKASQAGNATYNPAPDVTRSFRVTSANPFTLRAVALTNSVVLRWPNPLDYGFNNQTVLVRFSTDDYPETPSSGTSAYTGTAQVYEHTGRTSGETTYYTIFVSNDGTNFIEPE